jgi:hypothetical protein
MSPDHDLNRLPVLTQILKILWRTGFSFFKVRNI